MGTTPRPWAAAGIRACGRGWGRPTLGTALWALGVAALDGSIAGAAQRSDRLWYASMGAPWFPYSLTRHVVAVTALALLTVAVATALGRRGAWLLAVLMILAVVAGPLAVTASPVSRRLLDESLRPRWWWPVLVGAVHVAVLVSWAAWTGAALRRRGPGRDPAGSARPGTAARRATVEGGAVFVGVSAAVLGAQALAGRGQAQEDLGVVAMLGWALLAGGLAAAVAGSARRWTAAAAFAATVTVLATLTAAYDRDGGWPGVAGWEPITSPFVLSWTSTVAVCVAPLAGGAWRRLRFGRQSAIGSATATSFSLQRSSMRATRQTASATTQVATNSPTIT